MKCEIKSADGDTATTVACTALFRPFDPFYMSSWKAESLVTSSEQQHQQHQQHQQRHHLVHDTSRNSEEMSVYSDCSANSNNEMDVRQNLCKDVVNGVPGVDGVPGANTYPCSRCPKVFEHVTSLEQHLAAHHASRSFQVGTSFLLIEFNGLIQSTPP